MKTSAREEFLRSMRAAERISSGTDLLDQQNPFDDPEIELSNIARRFHRNGVAIGCFVAFEAFVTDRTAEVAEELSGASLPRSMFPDVLVRETRSFAPLILAEMLGRPHLAQQIDDTIAELSRSWSSSPQSWTVPKSVMRWKGSNINSATLTRIVNLFGVRREWDDLVGVVTAIGLSHPLPTEALFNGIAQARHGSAHDARYSAEIIQLRGAPRQLSALAFAFDAVLSTSAACIRRSQAVPTGSIRGALELTRLVWRPGAKGADSWAEYRGPAPTKGARSKRASRVFAGDPIAQVAAVRTGPLDVVVSIREESPGVVRVVDWRVPH